MQPYMEKAATTAGRIWRVPTDVPPLKNGYPEPSAKQGFALDRQSRQALFALEPGQLLGAQVNQKAHAPREHGRTLQQPRALRLRRPGQADLGHDAHLGRE